MAMEQMPQLGERWQRARAAALTRAASPAETTSPADEIALARRTLFDNSLRLGASFSRYHATTLELDQLPAALEQLAPVAAPCLDGAWSAVPGDAPALRLERAGCPDCVGGPNACDDWREAIAGLVLGVTGGLVHHARHASQGHGAARCVDVFYVDPQSPLRFGPLPDAMREPLAAIARAVALFDSSFAVTFLGLSEHVLYYALAPTRGGRGGCGDSANGLSAQPLVERRVRQRFPELSLFEVTPRTVLGDS